MHDGFTIAGAFVVSLIRQLALVLPCGRKISLSRRFLLLTGLRWGKGHDFHLYALFRLLGPSSARSRDYIEA